MKFSCYRYLLLFLLACLGTTAPAEEAAHDTHETSHHGHKNAVQGFIGITGEDRRDRAITLGVDYNRWLTPTIGIGIGAEHAFGDLDFTVVAVPLLFRMDRWKFLAGPGWEKSDHHDGSEFLIRAGVEYIFKRSGYEIAPKFMVDFIDGDVVLIGGVAIGFGF